MEVTRLSELFSNCKDDDLFYMILISALFENSSQKWDALRNRENTLLERINSEYTEYFQEIFKTKIPTHTVSQGTPLFRARCIKTSDASKLGVNMGELLDSFCKIFFSEKEIKEMKAINESGGLTFTPELLYFYKMQNNDNISNEQRQQIDELINLHSVEKDYGFSEKDSRVPPLQCRKPGRLNTSLDPFLYVAFDRDTAIYEMRPSIGQNYSLAKFMTNKDVVLADLTGEGIKSEGEYCSYMPLADKISEPNTDNNETFYHITQHMSHMLQEQGYDGIMYKSALKKNKNNVLLFDETVVDFISSEITEINDVNVFYSTILPFSKFNNEQFELILKRRLREIDFNVEAYAKNTVNGILVLKGSKIAPLIDISNNISKEVKQKREKCKIDNYILQEDILFNSASSAAQFVTGKKVNGKTSWKNKEGKTLKELNDKL